MLQKWFFENSDLTLSQQTDALKGVIECIRAFSLWVFLSLAIILIAVGIFINFKFREKFLSYLKTAISITVGFALSLITVLLFLQISRLSMKGEINLNFWLWVGFSCLAVISMITLVVLKSFNFKHFKLVALLLGALIIAYAIVLLFLYPTESGFEPLGGKGLYITLSSVLVLLVVALSFIFDKTKNVNNTKALTYAGICIAIAYALSYIKIFDGPQGSSVTLASMLPIMLYSYMFGSKRGVLAGLVYGVLQCLQDPQIYEPLQVMLDYPIAFSCLGLAGIFKNSKFIKNKLLKFILGIAIAGTLRYCTHLLSGYFVFYSYAAWSDSPLLQTSPFLYSLVYNTGVLIDTAIDVAVGFALFSSRSMLHQVESINPQ